MTRIQEKLDAAREELLDLSLRNKLLNYRLLKSRGVEVVDERPAEIFRILVTNGQVMRFLAQPEPEEAEEDTPHDDGLPATAPLAQPEETPDTGDALDEIGQRHRDNYLQTSHLSANLQKRLLNTFYTARTYLQEQGVNILYLALGMLEWYESDASDVLRRAPLILVPVELDRTNVRANFRIRHTEEEIGDNLSLRARLRSDLGLRLPELPEGEDVDVPAYFAQVEKAVADLPRWRVDRRAVALGFFSFGTFLMYNDLDAAVWPEEEQPLDHPLLRAVLERGFREPPPAVDDDEDLDEHVSPEDNFQVMDADSSQTLAILDVNQGRNLVIQGPPGTGKSQTITNLIAEALGQGRTVLFVAEKMAALEVVKRRLDNVGLGAACLELHSHKSNKRAFLEELQRTLELGRPRSRDYAADIHALETNRERLNDYCDAVNTPVGRSGVTPFRAYGQLLTLAREMEGVRAPKLDNEPMREWDGTTYRTWLERVQGLEALLKQMGVPEQHPFWGSRRLTFLTSVGREVRAAAEAAGRAVLGLHRAAGRLAGELGLPAPAGRQDAETLAAAAETILAAPNLHAIRVRDRAWLDHAGEIELGLAWGARLAELHRRHDALLLPEAWEQDVLQMRTAYANYGPRWWRFLSGDFRRAKRRLVGLLRGPLPPSVDEQMALVEAILEAQRLKRQLAELDSLLDRLFGPRRRAADVDWDAMANAARWLTTLYDQIRDGHTSPQLVEYLAGAPDFARLRALVDACRQALDTHREAAAHVMQLLEMREAARFGPESGFVDLPFERQQPLLRTWHDQVERLPEMVSFNHQARHFHEAGLDRVLAVAARWGGAGEQLTNLFRRTWHEMVVARAMADRPVLASFNGDTHLQHVERFRDADRFTFRINQIQLALNHWQQLPRHEAGGTLGILQREFAKKRRHLPIRRLLEQAGRAIQTIKPVFMMSPMSIAQFLPPGHVSFDLVVFDEASQVRPVEAFGALLRGKQAVVVGDSKQLPPTHFFSQIAEAEEEDLSPTADLESVLGLFTAQGAPQRMLRWHYRSQHDSLIAVSNREFYENRLVLFPSPVDDRSELGLRFHHHPATIYDRGRSRTNRGEARIVARQVMDHARRRLELTLGVAAFSISQMEAIQDELELLRREDPSCEGFFNAHPHEPFFVKNLENVQGDERDVIFISVGYGRDENGKVAMNFGPINKDGGERRLNVLTTRARLRCEIFSNISDEDIDLRRTSARGVIALQRYLKYARTGEFERVASAGGEPESLFEVEVARALRAEGYDVQTQVGSAGYFIDLAIRDAARPGRYLLGIECDGASYHSARWARDRDRLRQQVLERMGWQVHRIWSTDWFRSPEKELERSVAAVEAARAKSAGGAKPATLAASHAPAAVNLIERQEVPAESAAPPAEPYEMARLTIRSRKPLHEVGRWRISRWVDQVVAVEGPIHVDEVARRIVDASRAGRMGTRIRAAIDDAIRAAEQDGRVLRRGDFLWHGNPPAPARVRTHAATPEFSRTLDQIAPEEIMLAIERVVARAFGMARAEIPAAACTLLGFGRTSGAMRRQMEAYVGRMVRTGRLAQRGEFLVVTAEE